MLMCPECGCEKHKVVDAAHNTNTNEYYRKCRCADCGKQFFTVEFEVEYDEHMKNTWNKHYRCNKFREKMRGAKLKGDKIQC